MLLWLWRRLAATAPIRPLAWEPPYAAGKAQEIAKRQKKKKEIRIIIYFDLFRYLTGILIGMANHVCG